MRAVLPLLVSLGLASASAVPQQTAPPPPVPDQDGVYQMSPGIEPPSLTSSVTASIPPDPIPGRARIVRFTAVIAADGSLTKLSVVNSMGDDFERAATAAVQQSKFTPGTLNGAPVPVLVCLRVPFLALRLATPRVAPCPPLMAAGPGGALRMPGGVSPPRVTYVANPEYSNEARRKRIQGVVLLSTLVNEHGDPADVRVEKGLGYGLDENAVKAVSAYRFQPAVDRDGHPVAVRIKIEVSFQLF